MEHPVSREFGTDVEAFESVRCPSGAVVVVCDDAGAWRSDGVPVEVIRAAVHCLPGRLGGGTGGWAKQVESYLSLLEEMLGGRHGEVRVRVGQGRDNVVLGRAYASLSLVAAMVSRGNEVRRDVLVSKHSGEGSRDFVVHADGADEDVTLAQEFKAATESLSGVFRLASLGRDELDVVHLFDVYHHDVCVMELAGEVHGDAFLLCWNANDSVGILG